MRRRSPVATWISRAGICTALSLALAGTSLPGHAAPAAPAAQNETTAEAAPPDVSTALERPMPNNPNPLELPDEATASELKGQYGLGIGLLVAGGVITTAVIVGALLVLLRRTWSARPLR